MTPFRPKGVSGWVDAFEVLSVFSPGEAADGAGVLSGGAASVEVGIERSGRE